MKYLLLLLSIFSSSSKVFAAEFVLKSSAFNNREDIPAKFTCEGEGISPSLSWTGVPQKAKSLILIVDDPDAPDPEHPGEKPFTHWVVYNLSPRVKSLPEGMKALPPGAMQGLNEEKKAEYYAPCPPTGKHRYFFKLYALDTTSHFFAKPTKEDVEKAMTGHILAQTELVGVYAKRPGGDK